MAAISHPNDTNVGSIEEIFVDVSMVTCTSTGAGPLLQRCAQSQDRSRTLCTQLGGLTDIGLCKRRYSRQDS